MAVKAHSGQLRKASKTPYIFHPFRVAEIVQSAGQSEGVIIAALLHDVLEDTDVTEKEIEERFGRQVLEWVRGACEPEHATKSWQERKEHTIRYLKEAPFEIAMIICADKLDNLRSIKKDYEMMGEKLWGCFNQPKEKQLWYYSELVRSFKRLVHQYSDVDLFSIFVRETSDFFGIGTD